MEQDNHKHGFSSDVPNKDFFKALENRLQAIPSQKKQDWRLELRDKNVFQVPTGYFTTLESRLISVSTQANSHKNNSPFQVFTRTSLTRFAAAASIVLCAMAFTGYLLMQKSMPNQVANNLENISEAEIIAYLESSGTGNFVTEDFETMQVPISTNLDGIDVEDIQEYANEYGI